MRSRHLPGFYRSVSKTEDAMIRAAMPKTNAADPKTTDTDTNINDSK